MVKKTLGVSSASDKKSRRFLAQASVGFSLVLLIIKFWAFHLTQSQAVLSDALETVVNVVASALALWVIYWASQPADEDHPYGHGKAEFLSAAFEGGLIFFAALVIIFSSAMSLVYPPVLRQLDVGIAITAGAGIINGALGWLLVVRGQQMRSAALEASGKHLISDLITSVGVIIGLVLVRLTGQVWIDAVAAILMAFILLRSGYQVVSASLGGLLDTPDMESIKEFNNIVNDYRHEGIIQIHHVRMIISGDYHHIDAHVVVPEYWDVKKGHDTTANYEKEVFKRYGADGEFHFHIDPCGRNYCKYCPDKPCPIRREAFIAPRLITVEEMLAKDEPL